MVEDSEKRSKPCVGIAIVAWNNEAILPQCLDSVKGQTYENIKTIVLDNNSSDATIELIGKKYPWVELIKSPENTGFSKGNNEIIKRFMGDESIEFIVLLNSDASLEASWVESLVDFAEQRQKVAFMQGLTLDFYDHGLVDSTHVYINRKGQAIQSGHRLPVNAIDKEPMPVFGTNAAACMITRGYLHSQPFDYLFDEDFFMYLEDVDAVARSVILGWNNFFVPDAVAYHMGSASSGNNPGFSVYMVNRNRWPLLIKNLPIGIIVKLLPGMVVGDVQELYRIARAHNYFIIRKFVAGRVKGFLTVFKYLKKRRSILRARAISSERLWLLMRDGIYHQNDSGR